MSWIYSTFNQAGSAEMGWKWIKLDKIRWDQRRLCICNHQVRLNAMRWDNGSGMNEIRSGETSRYWLKSNGIRFERIGGGQRRSNEISWDQIWLDRTLQNQMRSYEILLGGIIWNQMTSNDRWDQMGLVEINWNWIWMSF